MSPGDLTVVVLARNEAARIGDALRSVPPGAATFVLDAESADATAEIAAAHGAVVEVRRWEGFVAARRYALQRVATPWTLFLDADERLDAELAAAIDAAGGSSLNGYELRRTTMLCGVAVHACGWSDEWLLRLVRTREATIAGSGPGGSLDVHERVQVDGGVGRLAGTIVHDSYPTLASYHAKFERYADLEAALPRRDAARIAYAAMALPLRFLKGYVRWAGWRDGWRGLFVAWHSARYPLVVRLKAWRRR